MQDTRDPPATEVSTLDYFATLPADRRGYRGIFVHWVRSDGPGGPYQPPDVVMG